MGRYGPHYRTAAPSFLRLLRLFAAKPGPARFRSWEERLPRIAVGVLTRVQFSILIPLVFCLRCP